MLASTQSQFANQGSLQANAASQTVGLNLCIIGDGATSLAAGSLLSGANKNLRVLSTKAPGAKQSNALPSQLEVRDRGSQAGDSRGQISYTLITDDAKAAVSSADGVVIAAPAAEYSALAKRLASVLRNGQTVYLINAPVAGGLEFAEKVRSYNDELQLNVIELGGLFDFAKTDGNTLIVTGQRDKISVCGNSRNSTRRGLELANNLSRDLVPCSNVLERGFSEVERVIRPTLLLFAVLSARGRELDCISNIINPTLTSVVVSIESELRALAKAYKCIVHNFFDTLNDFSGAAWEDPDCLDQALISVARSLLGQNAEDQKNISVESALNILVQDVCETLVTISELARLSRTPVPVINSVIELAAVATKTDLQKQGRMLTDLGLLGFDVAEIVELVNS